MQYDYSKYPESIGPYYEIRKKWTGKLRSSCLFKYLVILYSYCFNFYWVRILHYKHRKMWLSSQLADKTMQELNRKGIEILHDDANFKDLASKINSMITQVDLDNLAQQVRLKREKNDSFRNYDASLEVNDDIAFEILSTILKPDIMSKVCSYFQFVPRLGSMAILYGEKSIYDRPLCAQQWHRDGGQYRSLEIFVYLKKVTRINGAFHAIGFNSIPFESIVFPHKDDQSLPPGVRGRIADSEMLKFVDHDACIACEGEEGTAIFVDTGSLYHKGNFSTEGTRLAVHVSFFGENEAERKSVLDILELNKNDERLNSLVDDKLKQHLVSPYENDPFMNLSKKTFALGKGYLYGYLAPEKR